MKDSFHVAFMMSPILTLTRPSDTLSHQRGEGWGEGILCEFESKLVLASKRWLLFWLAFLLAGSSQAALLV
ncbi:MAG: hypothetical protein HY674_09805 [Chloroflexi bacterium]|nr:hypothetical protein [Chloroflexota bacterium]